MEKIEQNSAGKSHGGSKTSTYAIGRKPAKGRPIVRLMQKGIIAINCLAVTGLLGMAALHTPIGKNAFDEWIQSGTEIAATVESISWVELEQTPFMKAGYDEHAGYNLNLLFERWYAAGVPLEDFHDVLRLGRASAPMIMGTDDSLTVERQQRLAREANAELKQRWPQAHNLLADENWLGQHTYIELDEQTAEIVDEYVWALIDEMELDIVSGPGDYLDFDNGEHARELVEQAMKETGLRSLRLTSPVARDPQFMGNAAYKLIQLNEKLRARTGWDGAVLGLGGRVDWVLAQAGDDVAGKTTSSLRATKDYGQLTITSGMESAPHELWHGIEVVAARMAFASTANGTIMSHIEELKNTYVWDGEPPRVEIKSIRVRNHHEFVDLVIQSNDQIIDGSPEWIQMRKDAQELMGLENGYMLRGEEILASALTAQIYKWDINTAMEPSMHEADKHAPYFDAMFRAADSMELTKRADKGFINISNWNMGSLFRASAEITTQSLQSPSPAVEAKKLSLR